MKKNNICFLFCLLMAVACTKPEDSIIGGQESIGRKISLNELAGIEDTMFNGGYHFFTIPSALLTEENLIIYSKTKWCIRDGQTASESVPVIWITAYGVGQNQRDSTLIYPIGFEDGFAVQQWRLPTLPPILAEARVTIGIPADKQLIVSAFDENDFNVTPNTTTSKMRIDAHGSPMTGKFNTHEGFEGAAKAGYPCCIAVPKRTSDGVWVCFHDDDNCNELRYANGIFEVCRKESDGTYTQFDESGNVIGNSPMPISSLTWEFLQDKIIYNESYYSIWGAQKIPTLEDFFRVCKRTGMIPMLSVHPAYTASEWQEIKALAERCGVLGKLDVKLRAADIYVDPAVQVLGNSVLRYSFFVTSEEGLQYSLNKLRSIGNLGQDCPMIELNRTIARRELAEQIISNGFTCSVCNTIHNLRGVKLKEMNSWGVTEFTTCFHHNYGLNW